MRGDYRLHMVIGAALRVQPQPQKFMRRVHSYCRRVSKPENGYSAGVHYQLCRVFKRRFVKHAFGAFKRNGNIRNTLFENFKAAVCSLDFAAYSGSRAKLARNAYFKRLKAIVPQAARKTYYRSVTAAAYLRKLGYGTFGNAAAVFKNIIGYFLLCSAHFGVELSYFMCGRFHCSPHNENIFHYYTIISKNSQ